MIKNLKTKIKYLLVMVFIFVPAFSFAQFQDLGLVDNVIVTKSPSAPGPNQSVSVGIESYSFDLKNSSISWFVNGIRDKNFTNKKRINLKTGNVGSSLIVDIAITNPSGRNLNERVVIRPSSLDLLWEADTSTPPFYKGKALHTARGKIRVLAIADVVSSGGVRLSRNSLDYRWKRDGKTLSGFSGVGKDSISLNAPIFSLGSLNVGLDVVERGKNVVLASRSIRVRESSPRILFYEKHPLLGINFDHSLFNTFNLRERELEIKAYPYFFSSKDEASGELTYEWRVNNEKVAEERDSLLVRAIEDSGRSVVSLRVKNLLRTLQFSSAAFFIEFGN